MDPTLILVHSACPRSNPGTAFRDVCIFLEPMWCFTYPHTGAGGSLVTKSCPTLATPWTIAWLLCPWDFSRQEYWSGLHFLLQGIFPSQESNLGLLHCRWIFYWLSHSFILPVYVLLIWRLFQWDRLICCVLFSEWHHLEPMILHLFCFSFHSVMCLGILP